jgi:DNA-binding response OmpR family regulator
MKDTMDILVIEDHAETAETLAAVLRLAGYKVRCAHDGAAGLEAASETPPDVVLLDLGLPDIDGYEVARRLRQMPFVHRPSVIAVTGYDQEDQRKHSYEVGIDYHFTKPTEPQLLKEVLARYQRIRATNG